MPPLSQAKVSSNQEKLMGQRDEAAPGLRYQQKPSKYDDEQSLSNILQRKPVTEKVDKVYIKSMHGHLQNELFKAWSVQNVVLNNLKNQGKLYLYQPAFKELHFSQRLLAEGKHKGRDILAKLEPIVKFAKTIKDQQSKELEATEKRQMNSIESEVQSDLVKEQLAEHQFLVDIW